MSEALLTKSCSTKRCYEPGSDELGDLVDELGGEFVLAGMILRRAAEDLRDLRAGKHPCAREWPRLRGQLVRSYDPFVELYDFFSGDWCAFLADHLGLDPAALPGVIQY